MEQSEMKGFVEPSEGAGSAGEVECIVPFDFSEPARRALRWAFAIAGSARGGMKVAVVHAIEPTALAESDEFTALLEARARERLLAECDALAPRGLRDGVPFERECRVSDPVELVRSRVARANEALVVVGDRGLGAVGRAVLGSTTDRLLREIDCPMLVARGEPEKGTRPIRSLLVATDFSRDARAALEAARLLCRADMDADARGPVRVELVHVVFPAPLLEVGERAGMTATPMPTPAAGRELPPAEVAAGEAALARALEDAASAFKSAVGDAAVEVSTRVERGDLLHAVAREAERAHASVVVLGRHPVGILERILTGSTAERVVHASRRSVLTARAPASR